MLSAREISSSSKRTYCDRRLSILELAQGGRARLHAQPVAHALDQLRVRRPAEDNGTAHGGRTEKSDVLVGSKLW